MTSRDDWIRSMVEGLYSKPDVGGCWVDRDGCSYTLSRVEDGIRVFESAANPTLKLTESQMRERMCPT